jgi:hypothetical protein
LGWGEAGLHVDDQEGLAHGLLRRALRRWLIWLRPFCGGLAGVFVGSPPGASPLLQGGELWITEPQMQQNPHWAGFVLLRIWWAGVM